MSTPRRVLVLRLLALVALAASAALMSDALRPDEHGFCPLEAACAAARSSALGKVFGIPTSALGMMAFGSLLLLTLLPSRAARLALRPAGWLAALSGLGLIAYQAFVLGGFCPVCLVADVCGIAAGLVVLGWDQPPTRRGGKASGGEHISTRLRWALAGGFAVAAPLLWPHAPPRPSWVPLTEVADAGDPALPAPAPAPAPGLPSPSAKPDLSPRWDPLRPPPKVGTPLHGEVVPAAPAVPPIRPSVTAPAPAPAPASASAPSPVPVPAAIRLVEYLNPFCSHCRATHARLESILATGAYPVRRRRLYVWPGSETPFWARALVAAEGLGKEDALFAQLLLLDSDDDKPRSIWSAAQRAGIDVQALSASLERGDAPRLAADHQRVLGSRIEGLPTLDIGRRRLEGEQSAAELTEALNAALPSR